MGLPQGLVKVPKAATQMTEDYKAPQADAAVLMASALQSDFCAALGCPVAQPQSQFAVFCGRRMLALSWNVVYNGKRAKIQHTKLGAESCPRWFAVQVNRIKKLFLLLIVFAF